MASTQPPAGEDPLVQNFRLAMRRTAAAVAVVTTRRGGLPSGLTVSSFVSVSFAPPSILVCLNGESATLDAIRESGVMAVNILAENQIDIAEVFAGAQRGEARFDHGEWMDGVTGSPVLKDAIAAFDCRLAKTFEFGTHHIVIGELVAVEVGEAKPLLYHARTYGRFGE